MVKLNELVKRQTEESKYSHFAGKESELISLVEENFLAKRGGYKDGVYLVAVDPNKFFSGVVELELCCDIVAVYTARRKEETPFIQVSTVGRKKMPAKIVEIVVYDHETLGEDASTDASFEIVSINASADIAEPLTPMAMARNFLALQGGTSAVYSAEEFAKSIVYWSTHAMCG